MPRLSVNGIELYYEEHGEGVPVLGIHGTPSSALLWRTPPRNSPPLAAASSTTAGASTAAPAPSRSTPLTLPGTWTTQPPSWKFAATSPAVLAEIRGDGLDLSEKQPELVAEDLAQLRQPTLLVSAEDSPEVLRLVNARLAQALPNSGSALVTGGHLINPAHPAVLEFVRRFAA